MATLKLLAFLNAGVAGLILILTLGLIFSSESNMLLFMHMILGFFSLGEKKQNNRLDIIGSCEVLLLQDPLSFPVTPSRVDEAYLLGKKHPEKDNKRSKLLINAISKQGFMVCHLQGKKVTIFFLRI